MGIIRACVYVGGVESGWRYQVGRGFRWARNQEFTALLAALAGVLALWAFFAVAALVRAGGTQSLDERILLATRKPGNVAATIGPEFLAEAARDATALGSVLVLVLVSMAVIGFVLLRRQFHAAALIVMALGGGLLLNHYLKSFFARERPTVVPPFVEVSSASFPSGHALLSSVVYLTLAAIVARLAVERPVKVYVIAVALTITFLVGATRVFLGVHYPSDVLAGWSVGLTWAVVCWLTARTLQRSGAVDRPG